MKLADELDREKDLEELRRLARALHAQNQHLMEALVTRSREVERLRGKADRGAVLLPRQFQAAA